MGYYLPDPRFEMPELLIPKMTPTGPVVIDWSDSVTRDLVMCEVFSQQPLNLVDGDIPNFASNGTMVGSAHGQAWDMDDASSDVLDYGAHSELAGHNKFTIMTLVNFDDQSGDHAIVAKSNSADSNWFSSGFLLFADPSGPVYSNTIELYVARTSAASRTSTGNNTINPGTWQTITATFDGAATGETNIYLIGKITGNSPQTNGTVINTGTAGANLEVGRVANGTKYMDGKIAYLYIWDRLLSTNEQWALEINPFRFLIPA